MRGFRSPFLQPFRHSTTFAHWGVGPWFEPRSGSQENPTVTSRGVAPLCFYSERRVHRLYRNCRCRWRPTDRWKRPLGPPARATCPNSQDSVIARELRQGESRLEEFVVEV